MASEYIVTDRTTAGNLSITIDDGELSFTSTADAASSEPIVEDETNTGTYWKIFIDDGELGFESTVTVQDDDVSLSDTTLGVTWQLQVDDGEFRYVQTSTAVRVLLTNKINSQFRVTKSRFMPANISVESRLLS